MTLVLLLANGMAGNPEIAEEGPEYEAFCRGLRYVNETLSKKIAGGRGGLHRSL